MERCEFEGITGGCLRTRGKQGLDASNVRIEPGFMQRRIAFAVRCINPRAVVQQQGHERDVALSRCRNQRGRALGVSRFDVGSAIEQQFGPGRRALGSVLWIDRSDAATGTAA